MDSSQVPLEVDRADKLLPASLNLTLELLLGAAPGARHFLRHLLLDGGGDGHVAAAHVEVSEPHARLGQGGQLDVGAVLPPVPLLVAVGAEHAAAVLAGDAPRAAHQPPAVTHVTAATCAAAARLAGLAATRRRATATSSLGLGEEVAAPVRDTPIPWSFFNI